MSEDMMFHCSSGPESDTTIVVAPDFSRTWKCPKCSRALPLKFFRELQTLKQLRTCLYCRELNNFRAQVSKATQFRRTEANDKLVTGCIERHVTRMLELQEQLGPDQQLNDAEFNAVVDFIAQASVSYTTKHQPGKANKRGTGSATRRSHRRKAIPTKQDGDFEIDPALAYAATPPQQEFFYPGPTTPTVRGYYSVPQHALLDTPTRMTGDLRDLTEDVYGHNIIDPSFFQAPASALQNNAYQPPSKTSRYTVPAPLNLNIPFTLNGSNMTALTPATPHPHLSSDPRVITGKILTHAAAMATFFDRMDTNAGTPPATPAEIRALQDLEQNLWGLSQSLPLSARPLSAAAAGTFPASSFGQPAAAAAPTTAATAEENFCAFPGSGQDVWVGNPPAVFPPPPPSVADDFVGAGLVEMEEEEDWLLQQPWAPEGSL